MSEMFRVSPVENNKVFLVKEIIETRFHITRWVKIITEYTTGSALRSIDNPVKTSELTDGVVCLVDHAVLENPNAPDTYEFSPEWDDLMQETFKTHWTDEGWAHFEVMDAFSKNETVKIIGPITIDKVDGPSYTNIVETDIQTVNE